MWVTLCGCTAGKQRRRSECRFDLDYRHCDRKRPKFIKHVEIEGLAAQARQQLVAGGVDAIAFGTLRQIDRLKINGIDFALEVSTESEVHDEQGNHVFGICEFDPGVPDTAMVCVSPIGEKLSGLLALSTLAHELGHAVFDAPGWIMDGSKGPGLFDTFEPCGARLPHHDARQQHLAKSPTTGKAAWPRTFISQNCAPMNSWVRCWCHASF
jgi:hypothetical protein